ncbi:hypothetical protein LSAT2_006125 [Lamellibrachia satsuma]|nr:hypothetical protein LSAT2_006125 [Lamellibrachia satsuma]
MLGDVRIRTHQEVSDDRKVSVVDDSVSAPQNPLDHDDIRLLNLLRNSKFPVKYGMRYLELYKKRWPSTYLRFSRENSHILDAHYASQATFAYHSPHNFLQF